MRLQRKIEMVVEQDEIILVRRKGKAVRLWCNQCEEQVLMLRVEDASALTGTTARAIYRWVEAGKLHFAEQVGLLLVCAKSLATFRRTDHPAERKTATPALEDLSRESDGEPGKRR